MVSIIVQTKDAILFIFNSSRKYLLYGYMRRAMQSVLYLDYLMHLSPQGIYPTFILQGIYQYYFHFTNEESDIQNRQVT